MDNKSKLKERIAKLLEGPYTRCINFTTGFLDTTPPARTQSILDRTIQLRFVTINHESFKAVASAIRAETIPISIWKNKYAEYRGDSNALSIPSPPIGFQNPGVPDANAINFRSLLVHEATHAAMDMTAIGVTPHPIVESIAYLAQTIALEDELKSIPGGPHPLNSDIFDEASAVIKRFNLARRSFTGTPAFVHEISLAILKNKIFKESEYKGKENSVVDFNGISTN